MARELPRHGNGSSLLPRLAEIIRCVQLDVLIAGRPGGREQPPSVQAKDGRFIVVGRRFAFGFDRYGLAPRLPSVAAAQKIHISFLIIQHNG